MTEPKPRSERDDTDASLLAERAKTDAELVTKRTSLEREEDHIVEVARELAEDTLGAARERADRDLAMAGATPDRQRQVDRQREAADGALEDERAVADGRLRVEREAHLLALAALLRLERDATDEGLVVERARADEIVATRDDFLGMVSHDLRNILGNIAMNASMLAKPPGRVPDAATVATVERIQRGTARMNRLVGDLLDVVSLEAGALHITTHPHDAKEIANEAAEAYRPSFLSKGVTLTTETDSGSHLAEFDHDRVLQVLANILSNALKFTEHGGRVTLSLAGEASEIQFSVSDTGVGIPADQTTAVFDRFGQVRRDRRGHGLGLYISKCIVDAHGGKIWVDSPKQGGTTLHFTLPRASPSVSKGPGARA